MCLKIFGVSANVAEGHGFVSLESADAALLRHGVQLAIESRKQGDDDPVDLTRHPPRQQPRAGSAQQVSDASGNNVPPPGRTQESGHAPSGAYRRCNNCNLFLVKYAHPKIGRYYNTHYIAQRAIRRITVSFLIPLCAITDK